MQKTGTFQTITLRGGQIALPAPRLLLPIGTTFHLLEPFLPFAAPPVGGAFWLPLPALGGASVSLAAFDVGGTLAASGLVYRGSKKRGGGERNQYLWHRRARKRTALVPELLVAAVRRVLVRFS